MKTAIDDLYGQPLESFIARRKELAAERKKAGDKESAAVIAAMAKPSVSAWAVNHLHRTAPDDLEALFASGKRLREAVVSAMRGGDAKQVSTLQAAHREAVEGLVKKARSDLGKAEHPASDAVLSRLRTSLTTLSTTGSWGEGTEPGALVKDLDPIDVATLALLVDAEPKTAHRERAPAPHVEHDAPKKAQGPKAPKPEAKAAHDERAERLAKAEEAKREAKAAVSRAESAETEAEGTLRWATKHLEAADRRLDDAARRITDLEEKLATARADHEKAKADRHEGKIAVTKSEKAVSAAAGEREAAESTLATAERALAKLRAH